MVHRDLVMNMLKNVDRRNHGILDWASYLHAMTYIRPYDLEARVESCISTVEKLQIPSKELVQKIVKEEGGGACYCCRRPRYRHHCCPKKDTTQIKEWAKSNIYLCIL